MTRGAAAERAAAHFLDRFREVEEKRSLRTRGRRIGSELKFPLVRPDGTAADGRTTAALWEFLARKGWEPLLDPHSREVIGATRQGEMNEHRASSETGYCKVEFSLAHTDDLLALERTVLEIRGLLREFSDEAGVAFLGFGLQPVTRPGRHLLMNKSRNLFWDRIFGGNSRVAPEDGTDVHLFTINASNQAHVDVTLEEAVDAVNVFNGLAGAQVAMTANSNVWKGRVDPEYKCAGEMFWDWWLGEAHSGRYGVPERKFSDLEDYFFQILAFPPVYVRREGSPVALPHCRSFLDYYVCGEDGEGCARRGDPCGLTADGGYAGVEAIEEDLDRHFTFFWHNARLSRYYTLENRINDQQPPEDMMAVPAFTLGVMENLGEAVGLVEEYPWETLRESRVQAARHGLGAEAGGVRVAEISRRAVEVAREGLRRRGRGEERFLDPLWERLSEGFCPADRAAGLFAKAGPRGFVEKTRL